MQGKIDQELMDYINLLKEVNTDGVEPLTHLFDTDNVFREDLVTETDRSAELLSNAPLQKDGMFVVPRTIGEIS